MKVTSINTSQELYSVKRNKPNSITSDASTTLKDVYAPSGISASDENSDKLVSEFQNEIFYKDLKNRAVSSEEELKQQWGRIYEMYVPASTARKYYDPSLVGLPNDHVSFEECGSKKAGDLEMKSWRNADRAGCIIVPLGAGELPEFMDYVLGSLKNGISFEQTLQNHLDKQSLINGELLAQRNNDWFLVNPLNGDVMCALKGGRVQTGSVASDEVVDREAVYELADDLNTFLRYAAFPQSDDDPERVKELFSYIKNKQAYSNLDRFLADGEEGVTDTIIQSLIAAGVLKEDNEDEEEEKEKAVDGLMEAIRIHQEELRENKIDAEESEKTIAEIQEIIDGEIKDKKLI